MRTQPESRQVVCGLDDSPHAPEVLEVAATLAGRLDADLSVVHSASPDIYVVGAQRREILRTARGRLGALIDGHRVTELTVQLGDPAALLQASVSGETSLLVVGSRGHGPVRAVLGGVSTELAHSAPCPVVVVPPTAPSHRPDPARTVLCGFDGSAHAADALRWAATLARASGSRLDVVHVTNWPATERADRDRALLARMEQEIDELDVLVRVRMHVDSGDVVTRLDELAVEQGAGLIVVGTRGATPLRSALHGSVSGRLAATARTPVMIVSGKARLPDSRVGTSACVTA